LIGHFFSPVWAAFAPNRADREEAQSGGRTGNPPDDHVELLRRLSQPLLIWAKPHTVPGRGPRQIQAIVGGPDSAQFDEFVTGVSLSAINRRFVAHVFGYGFSAGLFPEA
jgi:hypothetical protein